MITSHWWMLCATIPTTMSNLKQTWPTDSAHTVEYSISDCHVSFCTDGESRIWSIDVQYCNDAWRKSVEFGIVIEANVVSCRQDYSRCNT